MKNFKTFLLNTNVRHTAIVFLVSTLASLPMFFVPSLVAYNYKISTLTDSFFMAYTILYFFINLLQSVVSTLVVPFIIERLQEQERLKSFVSGAYTIVGIFCLGIVILGYIVIFLLRTKYDFALFLYLLWLLPIIFFTTLNSLSRGILNSYKRFLISSAMPFISGIFIYICAFAFNRVLGIQSILLGFLTGEIVLFFLTYFLIKKIIGISKDISLSDFSEVRYFLKNGYKQLLGSCLIAATPVVDRTIAATISVGSISLLDYGQKVFSGFNSILNSFLIVMLPQWATDANKSSDTRPIIRKNIEYIFLISAVATGVGVAFAHPILSFLYPTLAPGDLSLIINIFRINTLSLLFIGPMQVLNRFLIIYKFTHLTIQVAIYKFIFNLVFDIIFIIYLGVIGLSLSSLINQILGYAIMSFLFYKEYEKKFKTN